MLFGKMTFEERSPIRASRDHEHAVQRQILILLGDYPVSRAKRKMGRQYKAGPAIRPALLPVFALWLPP